MKSLKSINFDFENDRLFSVGDIIDRGPESMACLSLLDEKWFFAVMGNHEDMMLYDKRMWFVNGGDWSLKLNFEDKEWLDNYYKPLIEILPFVIEIDTGEQKIGVLHADVGDNTWESFCEKIEQDDFKIKSNSIWSRTRIYYNIKSKVEGIDEIVVGHTPIRQPKYLGNVLFLDTGVVYLQDNQFPFLQIHKNHTEVVNVR